jgi:hypothetical protein
MATVQHILMPTRVVLVVALLIGVSLALAPIDGGSQTPPLLISVGFHDDGTDTLRGRCGIVLLANS